MRKSLSLISMVLLANAAVACSDDTSTETTFLPTSFGTTGDGDGDPMAECGNGVVEAGEECDDGNMIDTDACTSVCLDAVCGDGILHAGVEECDVGNETMFCDGDCTYAVCGDGYWNQLSEECDDGNNEDNDGCVGACVANVCGDGFLWQGMEECDDGNMIATDECTDTCTIAVCGDGIIQDGVETCEDGNMVDTDACTNACLDAECGDGILWQGMETCDDGNYDDDDACPGSCEPAFCGDGFRWQGMEECDDGNNVDDDTCTNDCMSNGVHYVGVFQQGVASTQQHCDDWNAFRSDLSGLQFSEIRIWGSLDQVGRTCSDPQIADALCQALASGQSYTAMCQGNSWHATGPGGCSGGAMELSADGSTCVCAGQYAVRPCIFHRDWGGISTNSCNAPSQTIEVTCQ